MFFLLLLYSGKGCTGLHQRTQSTADPASGVTFLNIFKKPTAFHSEILRNIIGHTSIDCCPWADTAWSAPRLRPRRSGSRGPRRPTSPTRPPRGGILPLGAGANPGKRNTVMIDELWRFAGIKLIVIESTYTYSLYVSCDETTNIVTATWRRGSV